MCGGGGGGGGGGVGGMGRVGGVRCLVLKNIRENVLCQANVSSMPVALNW